MNRSAPRINTDLLGDTLRIISTKMNEFSLDVWTTGSKSKDRKRDLFGFTLAVFNSEPDGGADIFSPSIAKNLLGLTREEGIRISYLDSWDIDTKIAYEEALARNDDRGRFEALVLQIASIVADRGQKSFLDISTLMRD